jgi:hypothetical protein
VAELMLLGPGCREERALYAKILAPRSDKRQVAATERKNHETEICGLHFPVSASDDVPAAIHRKK